MRRLNAQAIVVPAVTFAARVRLGEGNLTEIERVVLEAIGMGVSQVSTLTALLGLGARPTLDLLYDLWRAGHISWPVRPGGSLGRTDWPSWSPRSGWSVLSIWSRNC